jgi:sec-independent protein translocase protein TatA
MVYGNILSFMSLGPMEMIMIAIVGLLIFGNRLPDVGRSLGKGLVEFKKGLKGVQDDMEQTDREIDKDTNHSADS